MKLIVAILILLIPTFGFSCMCSTPTLEGSYKNAEIVFSGEVLKDIPLEPYENSLKNNHRSAQHIISIVEATELFKNNDSPVKSIAPTIVYVFRRIDSGCTVELKEGQTYLFFGRNYELGAIIDQCSGTKELSHFSLDKVRQLYELNHEYDKP